MCMTIITDIDELPLIEEVIVTGLLTADMANRNTTKALEESGGENRAWQSPVGLGWSTAIGNWS